ncbi:hypothetical protein C8R45DRAFT_1095993 [Mycena sanguinolenta]|nr:hypothetical protein C8R45DRAFT_1095993 [Mycena sanguinolenta]
MSLKAELEVWVAALEAYDEQNYEESLYQFSRIADQPKILTNIGLVYSALGEHDKAIQSFSAATSLSPCLAIAYFQSGVSNFLLERYELADINFKDALLYLRGNRYITWAFSSSSFQLRSSITWDFASSTWEDKITDAHDIIDDAMADRGKGYTIFSIPVGVLYRPPASKVKNLISKDYVGETFDLSSPFSASARPQHTQRW